MRQRENISGNLSFSSSLLLLLSTYFVTRSLNSHFLLEEATGASLSFSPDKKKKRNTSPYNCIPRGFFEEIEGNRPGIIITAQLKGGAEVCPPPSPLEFEWGRKRRGKCVKLIRKTRISVRS